MRTFDFLLILSACGLSACGNDAPSPMPLGSSICHDCDAGTVTTEPLPSEPTEGDCTADGGIDGTTTLIQGAGQRLHFSFGGQLVLNGSTLTGSFMIVLHVLAPPVTAPVVASCSFDSFYDPVLAGPRIDFDTKGHCDVLEIDGEISTVETENHIVIVNGSGPTDPDQIDVEFLGSSGIMIPGGDLEFGDFNFTTF